MGSSSNSVAISKLTNGALSKRYSSSLLAVTTGSGASTGLSNMVETAFGFLSTEGILHLLKLCLVGLYPSVVRDDASWVAISIIVFGALMVTLVRVSH